MSWQPELSHPATPSGKRAGEPILCAGWLWAWLKGEDSIMKKKRIDMGVGAASTVYTAAPQSPAT